MNFLTLCLTTLGPFAVLFVVAKFVGHKQIAQLDFFDYITGITIGSIAAEMAKLDLSEFMVMCRQQGYFDLSSIQTAVFEYNGRLTILPVSSQRPATPNDMNLAPEQELLFTELIMDGRILDNNLKRMGLDPTWLDKQLKQHHIHSPKDVVLALCDRNQKFLVYERVAPKD